MPSGRRSGKIQVYAVIRIETGLSDPVSEITVTEILPNLELAEAEVARLNRVTSDKGSRYVWQATRYYPGGRKAHSNR